MTELTEYTDDDVTKHNTEDDCWIVIGNDATGGPKVYNVSKYLHDHPGGAEIIMEFAGMDADEMFETIGHSSEAKNKMKEYLVGKLKVDPNKKVVKKAAPKSSGGLNPIALIVLLIAMAVGYYYSQMKK